MGGTRDGGIAARDTNLAMHGKDFYNKIGRKGGLTKKTKPFGFMCNRELASEAGRKGGAMSKRGKDKRL